MTLKIKYPDYYKIFYFIFNMVTPLILSPYRLTQKIVRKKIIRNYLKSNNIRKLEIGASRLARDGWLTGDAFPENGNIILLQGEKKFPFENSTFDYIYSEHMIEHINYWEALKMLKECHRVMKKGGKIRIATPDLKKILSLANDNKNSEQTRYIDEYMDFSRDFLFYMLGPDIDETVESSRYKDIFTINNTFYNWGHHFLYTEELLRDSMENSGFAGIRACETGVSSDPVFSGIERRTDAFHKIYETLILEAEKL